MKSTRRIVSAALLALAAACGGESAPEAGIAGSGAGEPGPWIYERGYSFVGERAGEPLVVPFLFEAVPSAGRHEREARAWLAHGETWDRFFEERWSAAAVGGVWRVLPHGSLRLAAGGPAGIESLSFQAGERRLRLDLDEPASSWNGGERERFRLLRGQLTLGTEVLNGLILEELRVRRRPARGEPDVVRDRLLLRDAAGLRLYMAHRRPFGPEDGEPESWVLAGPEQETSRTARLAWPEVRSFEQARRDIPLAWSFEAPELALRGEVEAIGFDVTVGEERGGRRAVEVGYTVSGWVEQSGERRPVWGTVRHEQG